MNVVCSNYYTHSQQTRAALRKRKWQKQQNISEWALVSRRSVSLSLSLTHAHSVSFLTNTFALCESAFRCGFCSMIQMFSLPVFFIHFIVIGFYVFQKWSAIDDVSAFSLSLSLSACLSASTSQLFTRTTCSTNYVSKSNSPFDEMIIPMCIHTYMYIHDPTFFDTWKDEFWNEHFLTSETYFVRISSFLSLGLFFGNRCAFLGFLIAFEDIRQI